MTNQLQPAWARKYSLTQAPHVTSPCTAPVSRNTVTFPWSPSVPWIIGFHSHWEGEYVHWGAKWYGLIEAVPNRGALLTQSWIHAGIYQVAEPVQLHHHLWWWLMYYLGWEWLHHGPDPLLSPRHMLHQYQPYQVCQCGCWVCHLVKTLYGLKQSGWCWYQKLIENLVGKLGFSHCDIDQVVFFKWVGDGHLTVIVVHVNDCTITVTNLALIWTSEMWYQEVCWDHGPGGASLAVRHWDQAKQRGMYHFTLPTCLYQVDHPLIWVWGPETHFHPNGSQCKTHVYHAWQPTQHLICNHHGIQVFK